MQLGSKKVLLDILSRSGHLHSSRFLSNSSVPKDEYDAIVIGGGHNGLVSAAYMAKSGLKTCVIERRHVLGGAAVTEEIIPGYKFSRASYLLSLLRPRIFKELELKRHGLKIYLRNPSSYTPLLPEFQTPGGPRSLTLGMDHAKNFAEVAKFSLKDAQQLAKFEDQLRLFVEAVDPLLDQSPPNIKHLSGGVLQKLKTLQQVKPLLQMAKVLGLQAGDFYELMTAPTTKILDKWFESEPLKSSLATDACIGAWLSPDTPGSGYVLLHHVMGEIEGVKGAWGYPEGGMGAVSEAIASSARESGAEVFVNCEVARVLVDSIGGKHVAVGVELKNGKKIRAKQVLSNATPRITFENLVDPSALDEKFRTSVSKVDYTSPVTKINVAVNALPNFLADPGTPGKVLPHHRCTIHMNCENSSLLRDAFNDAQMTGFYSKKPMIEMTIPSSLDPTLAPPGHHVCLFFTQYTPFTLSNGRVWDEKTKEEYANLIFDTVEAYAPGFKSSIVGKEVLTPPDLEKTFGLTGGNIFHGAMSLDQLFLTRPLVPESGAPMPETPISGLLLCGSGAHPGGGVMGAPGRLAALKAVQIARKKWKFE